jgi:threonine/homoserine efflux transporter RhtA
MRARGQIIFWAAVISIPISIISGDGESFLMAIGIIGLAFLVGFLFKN